MKKRTIKGQEHIVYDNINELRQAMPLQDVLKEWRNAPVDCSAWYRCRQAFPHKYRTRKLAFDTAESETLGVSRVSPAGSFRWSPF